MREWIDAVHPDASLEKDGAQATFAAGLLEQPGGLRQLIGQTTEETWSTRKKDVSTFVNSEAPRDPQDAWQWLNSIGESTAAQRVIPKWLERAPDQMAAYAAEHPEATQVRTAVLEAAKRLGVLDALQKRHPALGEQ